jgi:membrane-bound ClpP family serine protease
MKTQNYKNHSKYVFGYHVLGLIGMLALIVGAIINLTHSASENLYSASLIVLISFLLLLTFYFLRGFALKAQDRAIRAEENFRHYLLTQKPLPEGLNTRQIVGLRFASDEEFPALAEKAASENMSETDIKKTIKNWKGDYYRV